MWKVQKFERLSARYKADSTAEFSAVFFSTCGENGSRSPQNGAYPYSHTYVRNQSNSAAIKIYVSILISPKARKLLNSKG